MNLFVLGLQTVRTITFKASMPFARNTDLSAEDMVQALQLPKPDIFSRLVFGVSNEYQRICGPYAPFDYSENSKHKVRKAFQKEMKRYIFSTKESGFRVDPIRVVEEYFDGIFDLMRAQNNQIDYQISEEARARKNEVIYLSESIIAMILNHYSVERIDRRSNLDRLSLKSHKELAQLPNVA